MESVSARQQAAFDALITAVLARFASCTWTEVEANINTSLREIAEFVGVDYARWSARSDLSSWSVAYEWCSPEAPATGEFPTGPDGQLAFHRTCVLSGEVLRLNRMDDVPRRRPRPRGLESLGFKSTLQVPTRGPGGRVSGCIVLGSLVREMTWVHADVQRLRLVGDAIANAIERVRREKELRESEARYRATFQQAPVGILNVTPDGRLQKANQRFCEILGYSIEEVHGRHYSGFHNPGDLHVTKRLYDKLFAGRGSAQSLEKRYLRKDGQVVWGHLTLSRLYDNEVEPEVLIAVMEDITARKQAEEIFDAVPNMTMWRTVNIASCASIWRRRNAWEFPETRFWAGRVTRSLVVIRV